jgi:hypothetical protein
MSIRAISFLAGLAVCIGLAVPAASATVTVTNRDDKEHKLTVIEEDGAKKTDHTLKANQVLEGICAKGCVIRLNDSEEDEYELEGHETVSIEEGFLYYDSPETPEPPPGGQPGAGAPAAPPAKQPSTPPAKQ